jgi:hypothetical protein
MLRKNNVSLVSGEATLSLILLLALLGGAAYVFKPLYADGESDRAKRNKETAEKVVAAVEAATAAERAKSSAAAASVNQIGVAASTLPPSPEQNFIDRESKVAASYLPPPDPEKLLEAERRRVAIMEGRLAEADRRYNAVYVDVRNLTAAVEETRAKYNAAVKENREVIAEISEAAAVKRALSFQRNVLIVGLVALVVLFGFARARLIGTDTISKIVTDVRTGTPPITAFDTYLPPYLIPEIKDLVKKKLPDNFLPENNNGSNNNKSPAN